MCRTARACRASSCSLWHSLQVSLMSMRALTGVLVSYHGTVDGELTCTSNPCSPALWSFEHRACTQATPVHQPESWTHSRASCKDICNPCCAVSLELVCKGCVTCWHGLAGSSAGDMHYTDQQLAPTRVPWPGSHQQLLKRVDSVAADAECV